MSDDQFTLLFWVLIFIAAALFVIGILMYALIRGLSVWQADWNEWKDNDQTMNDQARKEQTETIGNKLDEILDEVSLPRRKREFEDEMVEEERKVFESLPHANPNASGEKAP
jgi:hypothetical protein